WVWTGGIGTLVGLSTAVAVGAGPITVVRVARGCGPLLGVTTGTGTGGAGTLLLLPLDGGLLLPAPGGLLSLLDAALAALAALTLLPTANPPVPCTTIRAIIVSKTVSRYARPPDVRLTLIFMAI